MTTISHEATVDQQLRRVDALDLEPIVYKLTHPEPGDGEVPMGDTEVPLADLLRLAEWGPRQLVTAINSRLSSQGRDRLRLDPTALATIMCCPSRST